MLIAAIHSLTRLARTTARPAAAARAVLHPSGLVWMAVFAYWPVWPSDEQHLFWLEPVWRRRRHHALARRWEYRSFRPDAEKSAEARDLADVPPLIH